MSDAAVPLRFSLPSFPYPAFSGFCFRRMVTKRDGTIQTLCVPAFVQGASRPASTATAVSHACVRRRAARPASKRRAAVAPPARPAQAASRTSTCMIRPPGPGQTSPPAPSAAPRPHAGLGNITASRRRGASSTCTGALVTAVRERRGARRAWGWWGPRRGGATCCHESGGAAGRRAWGRVAGEMASGRMRGLHRYPANT
jgi:hypothetical protein